MGDFTNMLMFGALLQLKSGAEVTFESLWSDSCIQAQLGVTGPGSNQNQSDKGSLVS